MFCEATDCGEWNPTEPCVEVVPCRCGEPCSEDAALFRRGDAAPSRYGAEEPCGDGCGTGVIDVPCGCGTGGTKGTA